MLADTRWRRFVQITFVQAYGLQGANFLSITAWAYWLGVEGIGIAATLTAILAGPLGILEAGLTAVVVTAKHTKSKIWTAWCGQQTILGFAILPMLVLAAVPVSTWYDLPELRILIWMGAALIPIIALSKLRQQWLYRELEATKLAQIQWFGFVTRYGSALLALKYGAGPYAFAYGTIGYLAADASASLLLDRHLQRVRWRFPERADLHSLAVRCVTGVEQLLSMGRAQLDVLILGHYLDATQLGGYFYLKQLLVQARQLFVAPLAAVMLPIFSESVRQKQSVETLYLRQHRVIAAIIAPALMLGALAVSNLSLLSFIADSGELLPRLGVITSLTATAYSVGSLMNSHRAFSRLLKFNIVFTLVLLCVYLSVREIPILSVLNFLCAIQILAVFATYIYLVRPILSISIKDYFVPILGIWTVAILLSSSWFMAPRVQNVVGDLIVSLLPIIISLGIFVYRADVIWTSRKFLSR